MELQINEFVPLTQQEKSATIKDLFMAKSGIYLPAQGEHDSLITDRPKTGSHKPGTYFFMNNFGANALGTIFIQETGTSIGEFMEEYLAKPLGIQDFTKENVIFAYSAESGHPFRKLTDTFLKNYFCVNL